MRVCLTSSALNTANLIVAFLLTSCCYKELQLPPSFSVSVVANDPKPTDSIAIISYENAGDLAYYDSLSQHFGYRSEPLKSLQKIELNERSKIMIRCSYSTTKNYLQPVYLPSKSKGCGKPDTYLFGFYLNGSLHKGRELVLTIK